MTKTVEFVDRAESELRSTRALSEATRQLWKDLDDRDRASFWRAVAFIVGDACCSDEPTDGTRPEDRRVASRLMLLKLRIDTPDPRWSSEVLNRYFQSVLLTPGGSLNDMLNPLLEMIGESDIEMSPTIAQFLKEIVTIAFTQHRREYDTIDWKSFIESLGPHPTQAQCYLALHAIPIESLPFTTAEMIVARLGGTRYQDEVTNALAVSR